MIFLKNYEAIMYFFVLFLKKAEDIRILQEFEKPSEQNSSWLYLNYLYAFYMLNISEICNNLLRKLLEILHNSLVNQNWCIDVR